MFLFFCVIKLNIACLAVTIFALPYTEFYDVYKTIPSVDDLLNVWEYCELDLEQEGNERKKALVIWYYDRFLPVVAGHKYFGDKMKLQHIPGDLVDIFDKKRVLIPITTEAFGILNVDNCYDRWVNTCEWKKDDPKRKIPKKGADAAQFAAKYTDSKVGQVKFGGWSPDAYTKFQELIDTIQEARKKDEADGWKRQKYARELVRKVSNTLEDEAATTSSASKKRAPPKTGPVEKKLKRLDE